VIDCEEDRTLRAVLVGMLRERDKRSRRRGKIGAPVAAKSRPENDSEVDLPETRYARTSDGVSIAYQVVGEGPPDIVFVASAFASNMEIGWEWPFWREVFDGLAARGRLLLHDRRGAGLSDGVSGERLPTLEARMEDVRAVMDAAGSERAVLFGMEDGAAQIFLFAATYPERTQAIVTLEASSRGSWAPDAPWQWTEEQWAEDLALIESGWGTPEYAQELARQVFPSRAGDAEFVRAYGRLMRHSLRKADAIAAERMFKDTDVRQVLPLVQEPTLVMNYAAEPTEPIEESRYIAQHIPGAIFQELPGADEDPSATLPHVDRFLVALQAEEAEFERVLATVLFTDIVGSTAKAVELGDAAWKQLVDRHHATVRALLGRYRGTEVDTAGDGFLSTFDGPARALRCAAAITEAVRPLGLEVRAGVHTGEVEFEGDEVRGIAVHIGARVAALADPGEVMVSSTVRDLVAGSGIKFEDRGEHELKGVPDRWRLNRVVGA
jgi:class 3 adenylate cyclase